MTSSHRRFEKLFLFAALTAAGGQCVAEPAGDAATVEFSSAGIPLSALDEAPAAALSPERLQALRDGFDCAQCGAKWTAAAAAPAAVQYEAAASTPPPAAPPAATPPRTHKRASLYASAIENAAKAYGLDPAVIHAVIYQESRYNPQAVSHKGAKGLMQLMDGLSAQFNIDPFDPASNIRVGAQYLAQQMQRFGSLELALAAYNAGPGAVKKYGGIPPYRETRDYVAKITSALGVRR